MKNAVKITVRVRTIDRFSACRHFKTLKGARAFAQKWVGQHPDVSETFGYAVGAYGDCKVEVEGATFADLFPSETAPSVSSEDDEDYAQNREATERWLEARTTLAGDDLSF